MMERLRQNSLLKISIGIIYLWFGALKFFPELSPAEGLATDTITKLTLGIIPADVSIVLLALLEVGIGICFLLHIQPKKIAIIALGHLVCTFAPLFFFNAISFKAHPIFLTLVGQYIIKNLIIIAALVSIIKESEVQIGQRKMVEN